MSDPIIRTKNLSMVTIKALLQVLKERCTVERNDVLYWQQKDETTNVSLTSEGINDLINKYEAAQKEYSRLEKQI